MASKCVEEPLFYHTCYLPMIFFARLPTIKLNKYMPFYQFLRRLLDKQSISKSFEIFFSKNTSQSTTGSISSMLGVIKSLGRVDILVCPLLSEEERKPFSTT